MYVIPDYASEMITITVYFILYCISFPYIKIQILYLAGDVVILQVNLISKHPFT